MKTYLPLCLSVLFVFWSCQSAEVPSTTGLTFHQKLSEFGFFEGNIAELSPAASVIPYDLNSTLFTDYAQKARFIQLPEGMKMEYIGEDLPKFPLGTILIKNFFYNHDERAPEKGRRIIETRLLVKQEKEWKVATYIWNDDQTEAFYEVLGGTKKVSWIDSKGNTQKILYTIPDNNDCKSCHKNEGVVTPIGPKIRNLNRNAAETSENQLAMFASQGHLEGLPEDINEVPKLAAWEDESFSIEDRARAYLEINCGHCHSPNGPANNTALNLNIEETDPHHLGYCKGPVSAAQGSGDLRFDIVPGNAEKSIVHFRMNSAETGVAMPEIGKSLVHTEGVELIAAWINAMENQGCN